METNKARNIYTVAVFILLASLDNAVIGIFPPLFSSIARDLRIHVSNLGEISAVNIFVISISSIFWGFLADKGSRKRLIIAGTVIWSAAVYLTARSGNYFQLMLSQLFTGAGLGCISSIGFSVLSDYTPRKWRGTMMSMWSMSQGFGTIAGSTMASIIAPAYSWRKPFEVIAVLGLLFIFLYFFVQEPKKGAAEPELKEILKGGHDYGYTIEMSHISDMLARKSNRLLILQAFFMNITAGTLIWLPTLFIAKIEKQGYGPGIAVVAAGYMYAISQLGGVISAYLGYLGDRFQKRIAGGRAFFTALAISVAVPLYTLMFAIPMKDLFLPSASNPIAILTVLIREVFTNPWIFSMFALSLVASAANSANYPNWLAMLIDVNLPEHRATVYSIGNLVTGIARSLGNLLIGIVLGIMSRFSPEPFNFIQTLTLFQAFVVPAAACYLAVTKTYRRDAESVESTLKERAKMYWSES